MRNLLKKFVRGLFLFSTEGGLTLVTLIGLTQAVMAEPSPHDLAPQRLAPQRLAQITPAENGTATEVTVTDTHGTRQEIIITGGQHSTDGQNLFHGFDQFNLSTGQTASFITAPDVQNVLGHITGGPSSIDGLLQVLGSQADLYLINPAGILFGPSVQLNLPGSLTAATATGVEFGDRWLDLSSTGVDYSTDYSTLLGAPTAYTLTTNGSLLNLGSLTLNVGQDLTLIGNRVVNTGALSAPEGRITITAVEGTQLVRIGQGEQILSLEVLPEQSQAEIAAHTLGELLTGGNIPYADQLSVNADGTVSLVSTDTVLPEDSGTVILSGTVSTEGGRGGVIDTFGSQVAVLDATLSAAGRLGGGTLRLGGDAQGSLLAPTARYTYVGAGSRLNVDATEAGEGGQVYIWSDEATQFYGSLSAQGGSLFGDGGFAEISGKRGLDYQGRVDLAAPQGNAGRLLFDPFNITIRDGAGLTTPTIVPSPTLPNFQLFSSNLNSFVIFEETLELFTNVTLQALHNIEIEPLSDGKLTFQPGGQISFQVDTDNMSGGSFSMAADNSIVAPGSNVAIIAGNTSGGIQSGSIDTSGATNGGSITITTGAGDIQSGNLSTGNASQITVTGARDFNLADVTAGNTSQITLTSGRTVNAQSTVAGDDGVIAITSDRNINVSNISTNNGSVALASERNTVIRALSAGTGNIGIRANDVAFLGGANSVRGHNLTLEPFLANADVYVGSQGPDFTNFDLDIADIAALGNGLNNIVIGRTDSTGSTHLQAAITNNTGNGFSSPVSLRGNTMTAASATLIGPDASTTWNISGLNSGTVQGYNNLTFSNFGNIAAGGNNPSTVVFNNAMAQISESITTANGNLTLVGDDITLPRFTRGTNNAGLFIRPVSTGVAIELGGATDPGTPNVLNIINSELAGIVGPFRSVTFGDNNSGPLRTVGGLSTTLPINLRSGATIDTTAGLLEASGDGSFNLLAPDGIAAGHIRTARGDIDLESTGNITVASLDARLPMGQPGRGGDITVQTTGRFQATGTTDNNNDATSIATGGRAEVDITHGGNGQVPFSIGSNTINGTIGTITNGIETLSNRIFLGNYDGNNIEITTNVPPVAPPTVAPAGVSSGPSPDTLTDSSFSVELDSSEAQASREIFSRIESAASAQFEQFLSLGDRARPDKVATLEQVQDTLTDAEKNLAITPALLYVYFVPNASSPDAVSSVNRQADGFLRTGQPDDQLEVMLIPPHGDPIRRRPWGVTRAQVEAQARELRAQATRQVSRRQDYLPSAQQLNQWIIEPIEAELTQMGIDNLAFIMDDGLRTIPIAVLHDGEQFLVERYSLALMPTFSLTDLTATGPRQSDRQNHQVLAMGASEFLAQPPLPAVEAELSLVAEELWQGEAFLNAQFTADNLKTQLESDRYRMLHLATHAVFNSGDWDNSYIQLWDERISLNELNELDLHRSDIELIILSACNTALGDRNSEYGFAGFAVNAGSQSALASLWPVSDEGTLGFMSQFYEQLAGNTLRSQALRAAQISMLRGEISIVNGELKGPDNETLATVPALAESGNWDFSHPFYWSAFTMIGNPW